MSKCQYNYKCGFFLTEKEIQITICQQQILLRHSSYLYNMAKNENFPIFLNLKLSVIKGI